MRVLIFSLLMFFSFYSYSQDNLESLTMSDLDSIASVHFNQGNFDAAVPVVQELIKKGQEANEPEIEIEWKSNLALLYNMLGLYEQAEPLFLEAKERGLVSFGENAPNYIQSLNNLALLYVDMQKFDQAMPILLEIKSKLFKVYGEKHPMIPLTLNNIAGLHIEMNEHKKAEPFLLEALELRKEIFGDKHPDYLLTLSNLGGFYMNLGKYEEALALFHECEKTYKNIFGKIHKEYALVLTNLGQVNTFLENYELAEKYLLEAVEVRLKLHGKTNPEYFKPLIALARNYSEMGAFEKSKGVFCEALLANCKDKGVDSLGFCSNLLLLHEKDFVSMTSLVNTLTSLYQACHKEYERSQNEEVLKSAYSTASSLLLVYEKIRNSLNSEKDKLNSLGQTSEMVNQAILTGLKLTKEGDNTYLNNSFSYAEQNKSILLADAVKGQRAKSLSNLPETVALKEIALQQQRKELEKVLAESPNDSTKALVLQMVSGLNIEIDNFIKELKEKYPKYHALKYKTLKTKVGDIQALLDDKTMLLEYFVTDTVTYLFSVTKDSIKLFPISISKNRLALDIKGLRRALSNYSFIAKDAKRSYDLFTQKAYSLYRQLLKVALKDSDVSNLIIITDGELGHLPFEIFLQEVAPQNMTAYKDLSYLIKKYNVSYDYSATLFKENLETEHKDGKGEMLACAAAYNPADTNDFDVLRPYHVAKLRRHLKPLPAAREEVKKLESLFEGTFLQGSASNEAFFKEHASEYEVIHLAMHGILHPRVPILSSLAFSEDKDTIEDNFLQAYEIAHLGLNANLVVLSACETGLGKFEQGEGIISLARSFMYAGVPSLVVSLWQVNDYSTAIVMQYFYQYLADGSTKDAALRQAKLNYLNRSEGLAAHPAFWSAFIQLGDSRPIYIKKKGDRFLLNILGLVLVVAVGGFILIKRRRRKEV